MSFTTRDKIVRKPVQPTRQFNGVSEVFALGPYGNNEPSPLVLRGGLCPVSTTFIIPVYSKAYIM